MLNGRVWFPTPAEAIAALHSELSHREGWKIGANWIALDTREAARRNGRPFTSVYVRDCLSRSETWLCDVRPTEAVDLLAALLSSLELVRTQWRVFAKAKAAAA